MAFDYIGCGAPTIPIPSGEPSLYFDKCNQAVYYAGNLGGWHQVLLSSADALTAHAAGGQASATAITTRIARFTTVATGGDSAVLPSAVVGVAITVINSAASNAMDVFPASGQIINALAQDTAISVLANKAITFYCAKTGQWNSILTA